MEAIEFKSLGEQLVFTTVRIVAKKGKTLSLGTGFFFHLRRNNKDYIFVVTCKHVLSNADEVLLYCLRGSNGRPLLGRIHSVRFINAQNAWFAHPNDDIDIAILPFAPVVAQAQKKGIELFFRAISEGYIATKDILRKLNPIENVIFIGYPSGLWDKKHYTPIIRQGITATIPYLDFDGKPVFLISAPVFPGSSGSPVFLYDVFGVHIDKNSGNVVVGARFYLLGVLSAAFYKKDHGGIVFPSELQFSVKYEQFLDLGIVYKAETIIETIEKLLRIRGEI